MTTEDEQPVLLNDLTSEQRALILALLAAHDADEQEGMSPIGDILAA